MTLVPDHVLERWQGLAESNLARQLKHHTEQRWGYKHAEPFEDCWHCGRLRAVCKSKRRYLTIEEGWDHGVECWHEEGIFLVPYRCYWSEGLHWHVRTASRATDRKKLRKRIVRRLANPNK